MKIKESTAVGLFTGLVMGLIGDVGIFVCVLAMSYLLGEKFLDLLPSALAFSAIWLGIALAIAWGKAHDQT